jgi:hypothetical protein
VASDPQYIIPDQTALHKAAEDYYNSHGWVCIPLKFDNDGLPKRPIPTDWTNIRPFMPDIDALPWNSPLCVGIGILLGPPSNNLAVLDIDSRSLARAVHKIIRDVGQEVYAVRTARGNMHLYIQEIDPSPSTKRNIMWEGKPFQLEFKAKGQQVAAPPSPNYKIIHDTFLEWQSLDTFWELLDHRLRATHPDEYKPAPTGQDGEGKATTKVWEPEVKVKTRNDTLYVEAHRLREAGVPFQEALALLITRVRQSYQSGQEIPDEEIRATVASAYRKGVVTKVGDTTGPREFNPL